MLEPRPRPFEPPRLELVLWGVLAFAFLACGDSSCKKSVQAWAAALEKAQERAAALREEHPAVSIDTTLVRAANTERLRFESPAKGVHGPIVLITSRGLFFDAVTFSLPDARRLARDARGLCEHKKSPHERKIVEPTTTREPDTLPALGTTAIGTTERESLWVAKSARMADLLDLLSSPRMRNHVVSLIVQTPAGPALIKELQPPVLTPRSTGQPKGNSELDLQLRTSSGGIFVSASGGTLEPGCKSIAKGATTAPTVPKQGDIHDWKALRSCLAKIKLRFADETRVHQQLSSELTAADLVHLWVIVSDAFSEDFGTNGQLILHAIEAPTLP